MPTRNVNLTGHLDRFIETGITSGRFSNTSEVVREALRLLELREQEDQAKIEWLRSAAKPLRNRDSTPTCEGTTRHWDPKKSLMGSLSRFTKRSPLS